MRESSLKKWVGSVSLLDNLQSHWEAPKKIKMPMMCVKAEFEMCPPIVQAFTYSRVPVPAFHVLVDVRTALMLYLL